jgi:glycosyltransferase involved in cell wall biosynthesis
VKKLLFVSISFPPKSDPEALQTAKYFHYLQQYKDLQIDVVTSAIPTLYIPYDKDLEPYAKGVNQLIPVRLRENRYINFLRDRLGLQWTVFPDVKQSFHLQYKKVLKQLKEKPDLLYSRSDPKSSAIMAYKLKKALNVPWILHLSDPWADCPLENRKGKDYQKHDRWERRCVEAADIISLTSLPTISFYQKKYPEFSEKFRFFPNVFEYNKEEKEVSDSNGEKFRIVYTGGLAYDRSPGYLLEPLSELFKEDPEIGSKLEVIFAGDVDAKNRAVFQQYPLPFVKWLGKIPFKEALKLQQSANYLVLIDSPIADPSLSMFFPSKLLDYMVARKRILAITTPGSASDLVMRDLKGDVCSHQEKEKIKQSLIAAMAAFYQNQMDYLFNETPPEKYEALYNAGRLHTEINKLLYV